MRNVLEHLPDNKRSKVKRQIAQAYMQTDAVIAKKLLVNLSFNPSENISEQLQRVLHP
jgi:hypothetical protein